MQKNIKKLKHQTGKKYVEEKYTHLKKKKKITLKNTI